jgi:hypothetical protein
MTKIPWCSKETTASHTVFIVTKLGECISIDQMILTEVGFNVQLKEKFTKKGYKCECPLPKWHCQVSHLRPVQVHTQAATARFNALA